MAKKISYILTATIILGLIIAYFTYPPFGDFIDKTWDILLSKDEERIRDYFKGFGFWGPVAIVVLMILQIFLVVFPSWLPMVVAVLAYGFIGGVFISVAGVFLASSLGYAIGRLLGEGNLAKVLGEKKNKKVNNMVKEYGFWAVALFRVSPFLSNDAISIIAGMLTMGYRRFILATLTGIIPLAIAIGYFAEDPETLKNGLYWIGGAGLVLYGLYIYVDRRKQKKNR
ncbi:TVP38/TMEM64 family protein [Salegentibacter sp.]|uniref:TVP38/TMEM64 family protein n=1 Tax=Salegentibacter sp. TaxID=1903072 RepID=UPI0035638E17